MSARLSDPLVLTGRGGTRSVRFPNRFLLAPMEGITDRRFRGMVLDLGGAGGACTEFLRISSGPLSPKVVRRELGPPHAAAPVGVQIMAPDPEFVAASVVRAEAAGAPWIDLNFGCPVKRVFNKCAGSALLDHPERLGAIVRAAADATALPVSAKIRAGVDDASRLAEVLDACAENGAAMVALHARLRRAAYSMPARWDWIAAAAAHLHARAPGVPLIGNGGIDAPGDAQRMLDETGADGAMVGRAAFADPWIFRQAFGGPPATGAEARGFVLRYLDAVLEPGARRGGIGKAKQIVRYWEAGGLIPDAATRTRLLREPDGARLRAWFASRHSPAAPRV